MTDLLVPAALLALALPVGIVLSAWSMVNGHCSDDASVDPLDDHEAEPLMRRLLTIDEQANQIGYEFLGVFAFNAPGVPQNRMGVWQRPGLQDYLVRYDIRSGAVRIIALDLVSKTTDGAMLTSGNRVSGATMPVQPQNRRQIRIRASFPQLYEWHADAMRSLGWAPASATEPFERAFLAAVKSDAEFVKTKPLWPLRCVWWYLTQRARAGKPVAA